MTWYLRPTLRSFKTRQLQFVWVSCLFATLLLLWIDCYCSKLAIPLEPSMSNHSLAEFIWNKCWKEGAMKAWMRKLNWNPIFCHSDSIFLVAYLSLSSLLIYILQSILTTGRTTWAFFLQWNVFIHSSSSAYMHERKGMLGRFMQRPFHTMCLISIFK